MLIEKAKKAIEAYKKRTDSSLVDKTRTGSLDEIRFEAGRSQGLRDALNLIETTMKGGEQDGSE